MIGGRGDAINSFAVELGVFEEIESVNNVC